MSLELPTINLEEYLAWQGSGAAEPSEALRARARAAADALHQYGLLVVKDPRASEADNDAFLDMLEAYFAQPEEAKMADVRAELYYQVGATPSRVELPRNQCVVLPPRTQADSPASCSSHVTPTPPHPTPAPLCAPHSCERMRAFKDADAPLSLCPPEKDPKWRFFWRIGEAPQDTGFPQLNAPPVVPAAFPQWARVMDSWGSKLLAAAEATAQLAALGFGLPADTFSSRMACGPHLLAPTASDFTRFGALGTVLAGYHYDLNFISAHGRSRYPGLYVWTRDGRRVGVKIPPGCLLLQAGAQFQYLTGGHVLAGFHEVVVAPSTVEAIAAASAPPPPGAQPRSLWRISSTLFAHINSDVLLTPLAPFDTPAAVAAYPPVLTGNQVAAELAAINLGEGSSGAGGSAGGSGGGAEAGGR